MEHFDPRVIQVEILEIIKLLQDKVARVVQQIASGMRVYKIQEHLERDSIVQILTRMNLKAEVDVIPVEEIENRNPAFCQFAESRLYQSGRPLRPRIQKRPCECA